MKGLNKTVKFFFMVLLSFLSASSFAQESNSNAYKKRIDSLQIILNNATEDTARITKLMEISFQYEHKDFFNSFKYAKEAYALAEKTTNKTYIGRCLNYLGDLNWYTGDYSNASQFYYKALKNYEDLGDQAGIADCYRNIGWIYLGQKNYPQTLKYYQKSLDLNIKLGLKLKTLANYDDLGIVSKYMGNYAKSLEYCMKTITLGKELGSEKSQATGYGNLASTYYVMGEYALAIENFSKSNEIEVATEDNFNLAEGLNGIAESYNKIKNYDKAIEYSLKAMGIAKGLNYSNTLGRAYNTLAEAYSNKKDYAKAYNYMRLSADLAEQTFDENNSRQINEMSAKYESDKKELMINSLEKDKIVSEEKSAQDKKFKIFLIIFCFSIAVFSIFLFRGFLQKKKANSSLSLAYKEIEVNNKDINDSINYAKQIQRARLPNPSVILNHFPESFGLYKPKDVVSGDFYWFAEHENGKLMLVAADCTGHGIPGAFMSLIGIDELNHATLEKRFDDTSTILSSVNVGVKKALRQNEQNSMSRDGMDLALCIFDFKKNTLEYSGANRPLYYIRENQLHELTPTKAAIGGLTPNNQAFKNHIIQIKKGDMVYVFTDGFADQFGGPDGKKFMTKRFKDLLLSIHLKPISEQETILEKTLEDWQKDISQVDDILVLGIRI
jgi:serine phosphatase RsbU (regulator of sigma subunit)